ncbi:MAG: SusC/RagA family TonB-linked outer membrane protein [Bacteroidota bacterium]
MKKFLLLSFMLMFTFAFSETWAQERTISGKVSSIEDGSALPGVNVVLKGTSTGTVTDIDGNYNLSVPSEGGTLIFSFIGLATEEIEIGARSVIDLQMSPDVEQLSEVVITAVGIETNKRALGYSVQNVDAEEIVNARETNLVSALNSKIAGVNVVSASGSPGASARITIRGQTSITGSNEPLFVVDGVPVDNSASGNGVAGVDNGNRLIDVNPNDIASMTVLKGPAATALYGIRAANGAIIITTKRGETGKPRITYNMAYTVDQVNRNYDLQSTFAQGRPSGGENIWRGPETGEGFSWGPRISELEFDGDETYPYDNGGRLVPTGTGNGVPARAYDNLDNFFVNGYTWDNNISVSGGSEKLKYFMSAGRLYTTGVVPNATFARTSAKATITASLTDKLDVTISGTYSNSGGNRIQRGSNISGVMLGLLRTTPTFDNGNGITDGQDAADDPSTYLLPDGTQRSYRAGIYDNPLWTANKNPFVDDVDRIIGFINPTYEILPWMKASVKVGIDQFTDKRNSAFDINSATQPAGQVDYSVNSVSVVNTDALLLMNKEINEDIYLNATIGHNYYERIQSIDSYQGTTMAIPGFYDISNTTDVIAAKDESKRKLHGVFGDIKLSYKEMLFLNLTGRNDWSSTLPEDDNSFFYPSASLGFDVTEAFGIANNSTIPYAKVRASWGQVGNDAPIYSTTNVYTQAFVGGDGFINGVTFPALGANAFERGAQLGNSVLKPETTTTIEFGLDLKLLNGRIGLDLTYYDSETEDQIIPLTISRATGFSSRVANAGVITNEGLEAVLTARVIENNDFAWDVDVNFTHYESVVEELEVEDIFLAGFTSTSSRVRRGEPYGVIVGNSFQRNEEGRFIVGSDGWPLVNPEQDVIGDPNPDWTAGVRNTFSYKGISLSALLDIREGGDMWNGTLGIIKYFGTAQETADLRETAGFLYDGVVQTGTDGDGNPIYEENNTPVDFANPALGVGANRWVRYGFGGVSEESIEDASWVRLREVTLSYTLPSKLFADSFIEGISVSFTGRNLALWTEFTGIDPETNLTGNGNGFGLNYFNMPNTRSFGGTLKVTF